MHKIKYLIYLLFFVSFLFADTKKVYFYTTEVHISDFKTLKINFDKYLHQFGDYAFQAFDEKSTFEEYLKNEEIIVILSSWHYKQIAKEYNLEAKLVALKKESITDTKVVVGRKGIPYKGKITTAYSDEYTKEHLNKLKNASSLEILTVPKEIDALMSVGFGMSEFALVSKDSYELLKEANKYLADQMIIYSESLPTFRMLVASKLKKKYNEELIKIFTSLGLETEGKRILDMLGVDKIVVLRKRDLVKLGGVE